MKKTHPVNDSLFFVLVILLTLMVMFSFASFARAESDTEPGILDSMIGYKIKDFSGNTQYLVTPSPTGGFIVRDPSNRYPLYKIEDGKIYNFKREPQKVIKNEKGQAVPK